MRNKTLLKANFKQHKGTMVGIFVIMLTVSLTLISALSIWLNTNNYLMQEMERMQYGNLTAWTQGVENSNSLEYEIEKLQDVDSVSVQQLIYANYKINDIESDSEGQLIVHEPQKFPYRIFNETNSGYQSSEVSIQSGEIYISPSLLSTFDINIKDEISFMIGRHGIIKTFKVKGMFEDPFMGSSMIGMKGFLISIQDYEAMTVLLEQAGIDALASTGGMFHIKQSNQSSLNNTQFNQILNEQTQLGQYTQFLHSKEAIAGFMLILQNAFTGIFLAFTLILLFVSMIIIGYSIGTSIDQDRKNMGILKTIGYSGKQLRNNLKRQYLFVILSGLVAGMLLSIISIPFISRSMVSFAGLLTPSTPHFMLWVLILLTMYLLFYGFIHIKTRGINGIKPMNIIQDEINYGYREPKTWCSINQHWLIVRISLRQLLSSKRRYISVCITTVLLVFNASMIGRMNSWLGPDGKGMMDAFNAADLDIGVQLLGNYDVEDIDSVVEQYSAISDRYALAMPSLSVDGVDYTANIITEPERFHIQYGSTSRQADEIVITETIATDRNLQVNDSVTLSYNGKSATYTISGIYQCANDMGGNIGMSREGFNRIGEETKDMWCYHYFLEDTNQKQAIINALNSSYGGDVYIHENTWPGLFSIISAMKSLLIVMYLITSIFIMIVTVLTGNKIFLFEKRNLSIYVALGFTVRQLRTTFAIRYGVVAVIGAIIGSIMSIILSDTLVGSLMKLYGISNFASNPGIISIITPGIIICLLFTVFSYLTSRKIKRLDMNELVIE